MCSSTAYVTDVDVQYAIACDMVRQYLETSLQTYDVISCKCLHLSMDFAALFYACLWCWHITYVQCTWMIVLKTLFFCAQAPAVALGVHQLPAIVSRLFVRAVRFLQRLPGLHRRLQLSAAQPTGSQCHQSYTRANNLPCGCLCYQLVFDNDGIIIVFFWCSVQVYRCSYCVCL